MQVVNFTPDWFIPQKKPHVPTEYEAGKAMGPVWILRRREKSLVPVMNPTTIPKLSKMYPSHYGDINMSNKITNFSTTDWQLQFPKTSSACIMITMTMSLNASCNTLCETSINLKFISWLSMCVLLSKILHTDKLSTHIYHLLLP